MATTGQILNLRPLGMIFTVLKTSADTGGKSLELHWELLPGCNLEDALVHVHPQAKETYEILEGEMEFWLEDRWVKAQTGDKLEVPSGMTHAFRNTSGQTVRVFNTHQPALRMETYFEEVEKVLAVVTDQGRKPYRKSIRTLLYMSLLQNRFRDEIIARKPPDWLIRILGKLAKALGMKY